MKQLPKRNWTQKKKRCFFVTKQTDTETPEDHCEKLIELEKECDCPDFSTELLISEFITSITNKKLLDELLIEEDLDVPKVVEQIQQNSGDRRNNSITIREAIISNRNYTAVR